MFRRVWNAADADSRAAASTGRGSVPNRCNGHLGEECGSARSARVTWAVVRPAYCFSRMDALDAESNVINTSLLPRYDGE
jgi:hypothetical protein